MSDPAPRATRRNSFTELLEFPPLRLGEIVINRAPSGEFELRHRDDVRRTDLQPHADAEDAVALARFDDAGTYRPLKTAPNLRRGWVMLLRTPAEVRLASDLFYPGRVAAYEAWTDGRLKTTSFRETLERQTGMYRAAAKIGEEQANVVIAQVCRSDGGCLRTILWKRDANGTAPSTFLPPEKFDPRHDQTGRGELTRPLLCQEICNILVAEARKAVKGE